MADRSPQLTRTIKQKVVWKDITQNLDVLPGSAGDLYILKDAQAVAQSIRNCVLTLPFERYYNPFFGSTISNDLFEFVDPITLDRIQNTISTTIASFEPRALNVVVTCDANPAQHTVVVTIAFGIAIAPGQTFNVQPIVLKVRE
jgi:phage baseplate assembly protein W